LFLERFSTASFLCGQAETAACGQRSPHSVKTQSATAPEVFDREIHMHRRVVLTGLTAVAICPARAQTEQQPSPLPATPRPANDVPPAAAGGVYQGGAGQVAGAMGRAEAEHLEQTLAGGMVALQTSEIALQKAQNPKVKQFAQFERDEQTTLAEVLRSWQEPAATASTAAPQGAAASAPAIPADKAEMMQ
jgi:hypothetical protein